MKLAKKIALFSFAFCWIACAPAPQTPEPDAAPRPKDNPPERTPTGRLLFLTDQDAGALTASKQHFLQTTLLVKAPGTPLGQHRYNINSTRSQVEFIPQSPIVHNYNGPGARVPIFVSLPREFRWNIPEAIREQISRENIDQLDILFTPQLENRQRDASLKSQFWMFPLLPSIDGIVGAPPEYQKTVFQGIYDSDHPIDDQVRSGELHPFAMSLHDGRVSPDTGHLNVTGVTGSFAFYSLVVFERRAAVTLHWILPFAVLCNLDNLLVAQENRSFEDVLTALNAHASFQGSPMLRKLNALVNP